MKYLTETDTGRLSGYLGFFSFRFVSKMSVPLPILTDGKFASVEEKCMAIAMNMPAVQIFYNSKTTETQTMFQKVMNLVGTSGQTQVSNMNTNELIAIVKNWCRTSLLHAIKESAHCILSAKDQEQLLKSARDSGWSQHIQTIFKILNMPVKESYPVLEAVWDLDTFLYKYLHPFPRELEKSSQELARLEEMARKPLSS